MGSGKKRKESSKETSQMFYIGVKAVHKRSSMQPKTAMDLFVWYEQCNVPIKLNTGVCVQNEPQGL